MSERGSRAGVMVSAIGMVSPVGATATQTFTSVRAGIRRMAELPDLYACLPEDPRFDEATPLVGSAISHLPAELRRAGALGEWLALLAAHAFRDLVANADLGKADLERTGLFLALPACAAGGPSLERELAIHFHNHAALDLLPHFRLAFGDRTTSLALLEEAAAAVAEGRLARAAVGGVDSYLFAGRLAPLDEDWRLLSERNPDGFQPGEAAAFLLLEPRAAAARRGAAPLAELLGTSHGRLAAAAPGHASAPGAELAQVLERLLQPGPPPLVVCDLNGESARAREWGFALSRIGPRLGEGLAVEHPASALGDVGAATGALLVALAARYLRTKHADRPTALVWAADDDGARRAVLLGRA